MTAAPKATSRFRKGPAAALVLRHSPAGSELSEVNRGRGQAKKGSAGVAGSDLESP